MEVEADVIIVFEAVKSNSSHHNSLSYFWPFPFHYLLLQVDHMKSESGETVDCGCQFLRPKISDEEANFRDNPFQCIGLLS